jgi:hypothetical protein
VTGEVRRIEVRPGHVRFVHVTPRSVKLYLREEFVAGGDPTRDFNNETPTPNRAARTRR